MVKGKGRAKRQTKLTFAPLATSSPSADELSQSVPSRAAHVRYTGTRSRSLRSTHQSPKKNAWKGTIEGSFAVANSLAGEPSEHEFPTPDHSSQLPQYTGGLDGIHNSDPEDSGVSVTDESDDATPHPGSKINQHTVTGYKRNSTAFFSQASSPPVKAAPLAKSPDKPLRRSSNSLFKSQYNGSEIRKGTRSGFLYSEEDEEIEVPSTRRSTRSRVKAEPIDDEEVTTASQRRRKPRAKQIQQVEISEEEEDIRLPMSSRGSRIAPVVLSDEDSSTEKGTGQTMPGQEDADHSDSTDSLVQKVPRPGTKLQGPNTFVTGLEGAREDSEKEDEDDIRPPMSTKKPRARMLSDSDSDVVASPAKRKRTSPSKTSSPKIKVTRQERDDLDDDVEYLNDSSPPPEAVSSTKLSAKEKRRLQLEKMAALREKKNNPNAAMDVSDDDVEDDDEEEVQEVDPYAADENLDEYDSEFVNDEGAEDHGLNLDMPLEFTRYAHAGVKTHFKRVVEWMVHNKLNPSFARDDPIYRLAFQKVGDEATGLASSKLVSSIWKQHFNRALHARPIYTEIELSEAEKEFGSNCHACGRSSHPASYRVTMSGKAYHPETLENLKEEDDDDDASASSSSSSSDNDATSVDIHGNPLPAEDTEFFLGRFCKQNSARAHALLHWRWHLNDWVLAFLVDSGHTSADRIVEMHKWSAKKRGRYANKVVDEMEAAEIRNLWRDFKIQLEEANEHKLYL